MPDRCTCGQTERMVTWRTLGPFADMPLHDPACPAVNQPPREDCRHLWRGDMGDITAPLGYVKCAYCHGLKAEPMPERCTDPTCKQHWPARGFAAAVTQLRAEFGDPVTVWGRTGADAWETVAGMFVHTGWTPPDE